MTKITVNASRSYDVIISGGLLKDAGKYISSVTSSKKCAIISDDNVFPLYGETLKASLENSGIQSVEFVFQHGEESKNLTTYSEILEFLCASRLTREDFVIALGGGVTGDMAGFAAATYQRGIGFIQLPTTLLADVDSSVGGKTAVDLKGGKNQVGCFYQPMLVLIDTDTLNTLPNDEYINGCAEVIKYGVIGSSELFTELSRVPVKEQYEEIIAKCVSMKRDYVEADERDTGKRVFLNFGHTMGHAAELLSAYTIPHGRAVAMGMSAVTKAAVKKELCGHDTLSALDALLTKYNLPTQIPFEAEKVTTACMSDKKAGSKGIKLVVPRKIGECFVNQTPADEILSWAKAGIEE